MEHGGRLKLSVNVEVTPEKARQALDALESVGFMQEPAPEVKDDEPEPEPEAAPAGKEGSFGLVGSD